MPASMTKFAIRLLAAFALLFATAASAKETFKFEEYFLGKTVAYGKFSAINGVKRTFKVDLRGTWNGKTLKLIEDFAYDDGVNERKIWYFTKIGPGRYIGKRDDVEGVANVRIRGNTARYSYKLYLDAKNRSNLVRLRDKMVLLPDGTVRNTATVFKGILPVGRVVVNFARAKDAHKLKRP
ncbi:DUF3833 family protein [Ahrensia sp. R2A130]|uniref:DUF3833 family protein n=1 Tax=Ahrensia sp. R2A130 TaxID=744979 RepID=UPI0001E0944C|nr:DUF3833 family protein [Ahrensia sp. R2A130]EFL89583.1 putative lipoprotein [Ahrensia sp. R2A130]